MGLLPLEFTDCLTDSPYFRENLHAHERELDKTSQQIKGLIKEVKDLLAAARSKLKANAEHWSKFRVFPEPKSDIFFSFSSLFLISPFKGPT